MMSAEEIKTQLEAKFPGIALKMVRETIFVENPLDLPKIAEFLKTSEHKLEYLSSLTGADYLTFLECVYHFYSMEKKIGPLVLRTRVGRETPRIPSLVALYRSAEYQERETFDMYGIVFDGHPDLRRIFMWDTFEAFPMRKDYIQEDSETLESADVEWLDKHGIKVADDVRAKAEELKKSGKKAVAEKPKPGADVV